jgi:hypothetical protein
VTDELAKVLAQYGCGPVQFSGTGDALYDRHLTFDDVVDVRDAGPRERFEALARSVRDVLSQRWIQTEKTYARENPKRVYYLSMEFLTNLLLDRDVSRIAVERGSPRVARWWSRCSARRIATRALSRIRNTSTSAERARRTSRSAVASTSASARGWRGSRSGSRWQCSSKRCPPSRSQTRLSSGARPPLEG